MKKKLAIKLLNGDVWEVEAEIVGDLGLHPGRSDPKALSVTHIPTLMSFNKVIPNEIKRTKKALLAWMKKVQEGLPKDWLAMRKFDAEQVRVDPEKTKTIRARIREHCLATKEV